MKTAIIIFLLLFPWIVNAQFSLNEWKTISPVTDSSHHNRNACLGNEMDDPVVYWDQELDPSTTQLCFRQLSPFLGEVQVALMQPGVKLTNPVVIEMNQGSSNIDFQIFYQTNAGNDINLNYLIHKADGTIIGPYELSSLPGDDINLAANYSGVVAWENGGKIFVSQYLPVSNSFTIPFAIDSAGANTPSFSASGLNYLKPDGNSTILISEQVYNNQGNWEISGQTAQSFNGDCSGLASGDLFWSSTLAMQNKVGTNPSGLILYSYWMTDIEYRNSPSYNYTQPAIADYMIAVKNSMYYFLVYVSDSLTQNEIFAEAPFGYYPGTQNISQWQGDDRNPQLFEYFIYPNVVRVHLFWESERQGYSTIYNTYFDYYFGSLDETPKAESLLVSPCPFEQETTISFRSATETKFRIIDLQGREIKSLTPQHTDNGWQKAVWDGTNQQGKSIPAGSYIVVAGTGNAKQSRIVIRK